MANHRSIFIEQFRIIGGINKAPHIKILHDIKIVSIRRDLGPTLRGVKWIGTQRIIPMQLHRVGSTRATSSDHGVDAAFVETCTGTGMIMDWLPLLETQGRYAEFI